MMTTEGVDTTTIEEPEVEELDCSQTLPLVDYVAAAQADPEACVPCDLSVITPWYRDELKESHPELAERVDALAEGPEGGVTDENTGAWDIHVAETLDGVRAEVVEDEALTERLDHFNCLMQIAAEDSREEAAAEVPAPGLDTDAVVVEE
jgi:hypothetical protein